MNMITRTTIYVKNSGKIETIELQAVLMEIVL